MKILKIIIVITSVLGLYFIPDQLFEMSMFKLSVPELLTGLIVIGLYLFYLCLVFIYFKKFGNNSLEKISVLQEDIEILEKKLQIKKLKIEIKKGQDDNLSL